jgi:Kef-type K+ transport system membrane component KefB
VDLRSINPMVAANHKTLLVAGLLAVAAVVGKFVSGYSVFWMRVNRPLIGVGMIPRGEVGLIFAQMGMAGGVLDAGLFGAVTLMVLVTTFLAPPLLKSMLGKGPIAPRPAETHGVEDLVT